MLFYLLCLSTFALYSEVCKKMFIGYCGKSLQPLEGGERGIYFSNWQKKKTIMIQYLFPFSTSADFKLFCRLIILSVHLSQSNVLIWLAGVYLQLK